MNSGFVNPGIYSCAVCTRHLFRRYLSSLRIRNDFADLLFNVCSHYMSSREDSSLLREIREPVWSYIMDVCSSFPARDCNACFSQIFDNRTLGYLNEEEESLFMTLRTFDSFCSSCSNVVALNSMRNLFHFSQRKNHLWIVQITHQLKFFTLRFLAQKKAKKKFVFDKQKLFS